MLLLVLLPLWVLTLHWLSRCTIIIFNRHYLLFMWLEFYKATVRISFKTATLRDSLVEAARLLPVCSSHKEWEWSSIQAPSKLGQSTTINLTHVCVASEDLVKRGQTTVYRVHRGFREGILERRRELLLLLILCLLGLIVSTWIMLRVLGFRLEETEYRSTECWWVCSFLLLLRLLLLLREERCRDFSWWLLRSLNISRNTLSSFEFHRERLLLSFVI